MKKEINFIIHLFPPFSTFRKGVAKSFEVLHNFSEKLLGGAKSFEVLHNFSEKLLGGAKTPLYLLEKLLSCDII